MMFEAGKKVESFFSLSDYPQFNAFDAKSLIFIVYVIFFFLQGPKQH